MYDYAPFQGNERSIRVFSASSFAGECSSSIAKTIDTKYEIMCSWLNTEAICGYIM